MLEAGRLAVTLTEGLSRSTFESDTKAVLAVTRLADIIGEAASQLVPSFRESHPEVPWAKMAGMRNRLIHNYWDVDPDVLWSVVGEDIPTVIPRLEALLAELPE